MSITLTALMKQRYDTAANWTAQNPTLLAGEFGIESNTKRWKVGDGSTAWTSLLYSNGGTYPLVNADIAANAEIAVSKLADGSARQLLQTDTAGTGVEWTSDVSIPGVLSVTAGTAALPGIAFDSNTGIYSPGADQVAISTNGTGRLFVNASGNVGVGTASPVSRLHVTGGDSVFGAGNLTRILNASQVIDFTNPAQDTYVAGRLNGLNLKFYTNTGGGIDITSAGNVGIGTTSPSAPLEVVGSTNGDQLRLNQSGQFYRIGREGTGGLLEFYGAQSGFTGYIFSGANGERMRIDSSGRLLVGTSSARSNLYAGGSPRLQVEGVSDTDQWASLISSQNSITGPSLILGHQRSGTIGGNTILQNNDEVGTLVFQGNDGANFISSASIRSFVDGTPGTTDMPGRLMFSTTADGAASPTEALRITNDRVLAYNQPTPATYAAAATLTVADLKTKIITYTGAAATLTLPTGTLAEGGVSGIYTNMAFEWSVINTGAGICTIGAGTAHTIVGSATIAIGASARFASRRTAANTFVSYRLV